MSAPHHKTAPLIRRLTSVNHRAPINLSTIYRRGSVWPVPILQTAVDGGLKSWWRRFSQRTVFEGVKTHPLDLAVVPQMWARLGELRNILVEFIILVDFVADWIINLCMLTTRPIAEIDSRPGSNFSEKLFNFAKMARGGINFSLTLTLRVKSYS